MFIFQFMPPGVKPPEETRLPKIIWTVQRIKNEIEKNGPECPDVVAGVILKQPAGKIMEKIREVREALIRIVNLTKPSERMLTFQLNDDAMADAFVNKCDKFVELAEALKGSIWNGLNSIRALPGIRDLFLQYPDQFIEIAKSTGNLPGLAGRVGRSNANFGGGFRPFYLVGYDEKLKELFLQYAHGSKTKEEFIIALCTRNEIAIELGRPLDDLHSDSVKRKEYIDRLSTIQVLSLLLSNPAYFYTSTNHMLMDRLKEDLKGQKISDVFKQYGVEDELIRNFLFRTINYGRFCGDENCLLTPKDVETLLPVLLKPLDRSTFDPQYFFLLANGVKSIAELPAIKGSLIQRLEKRYGELAHKPVAGTIDKNRPQLRAAIEHLLFRIDLSTSLLGVEKKAAIQKLDEKANFNPRLYANNGKLTIVQVFDKRDTENTHWKLSQKWFAKYGEPKTGSAGELIYETATARVVLFMGEETEKNKAFIQQQLKKTPNLILTFRGHSFSLQNSFPFDIFGNKNSHVLFIPGSCGSAGSIAEYISTNPGTDLRFFSNTSTGRGQVTNTLVDSLVATHKQTRFTDILHKATTGVEKEGGDVNTIKVWSSGEALLAYVNQPTIR